MIMCSIHPAMWRSPWSTPHPAVWSEPLPCMYWGEGAGTINCGCAATGAAIPEKKKLFTYSGLHNVMNFLRIFTKSKFHWVFPSLFRSRVEGLLCGLIFGKLSSWMSPPYLFLTLNIHLSPKLYFIHSSHV